MMLWVSGTSSRRLVERVMIAAGLKGDLGYLRQGAYL